MAVNFSRYGAFKKKKDSLNGFSWRLFIRAHIFMRSRSGHHKAESIFFVLLLVLVFLLVLISAWEKNEKLLVQWRGVSQSGILGPLAEAVLDYFIWGKPKLGPVVLPIGQDLYVLQISNQRCGKRRNKDDVIQLPWRLWILRTFTNMHIHIYSYCD